MPMLIAGRYIDTEARMAERRRKMQDWHKELYDDGLIAGVKIGLVAGAAVALIVAVLTWL